MERRRSYGFALASAFFLGVVLSILGLGIAASYLGRLFASWSIGFAAFTALFSFAAGAAAIAVLNVATGSLAREGTANDDPAPVEEKTRWWHSRALVALATMGIAGSMLEGAPLDWGALYLTDELGTSRATAAATAVTFTIGMVASRLVGDYLIERLHAYGVCYVFGVPGDFGRDGQFFLLDIRLDRLDVSTARG